MLPYRLRQPQYGGKLKKAKLEEAARTGDNSMPLRGGGPVQLAIEQDLELLRSNFLQPRQECGPSAHHSKEGDSFRVFQAIFADAKVALLHTKFLPPRCVPSQYSQLLYEACFSLMRKAFREEATLLLEHAAFGLFCLYALYETNTLPLLPEKEKELSLLSMGLQASENPKLRFRRSFKGPIRIDWFHYSLLLQLREEALAKQADCQNQKVEASVRALQQRVDNNNNNNNNSSSQEEEIKCWFCQCGVAIDTIQVLSRVFPILELCEYTGPCNLEGYVGHANYPVPCIQPTKEQQEAFRATQIITPNNKLTKEVIETAGKVSLDLLPESTSSNLKSYRSSVQSIRIPTNLTNQKKKVLKDSLDPVLHSSEPTLEALLSQIVNGQSVAATTPRTSAGIARRDRRRVTWGAIDEQEEQETLMYDHYNMKDSTSKPGVVKQDLSYELILPEELPEALQFGMQSAMGVRLSRDQPIFLPTSENVTAQAQTPEAQNREISDDISSVGVGGVSLAQSSATGLGGAALKALMTKALENQRASSAASSKPATRHPPAAKQRIQTYFLTMDDDSIVSASKEDGNESDTSNLSDSDLEEDAISVATSAVGQRALTTLLSSVSEKSPSKKQKEAASKKRANASSRSGRRGRRRSDGAQQAGQKRNGNAHNNAMADDISQAGSLVSGPGKAALADLLARAQSNNGKSGSGKHAQDPREAPEDASVANSLVSGQGRAALLAQAQTSQGVTRSKGNNKRKGNQMQGEHEEAAEDASVADSLVSGQGKAELSDILTLARTTRSRYSRKRTTSKPAAKRVPLAQQDDGEESITGQSDAGSSVAQGKSAIAALIAQAECEDDCKGDQGQVKRGVGASLNRSLEGLDEQSLQTSATTTVDDEDSSIHTALSGQGNVALEDLLSQARDKTEGMPPPKRRKKFASK